MVIALTHDSLGWYAAFQAKDSRFDGRFFVGVSSTGIYCRPICRARLPKRENCTFFSAAAQAEQAGYRPCLLCRPEIAPGSSRIDSTSNLAQRGARLLEESCGAEQSVETLAASLGCTARHLRRAFQQEYQVSPLQYLQTCRLLLSKSLLTDSSLSVLEVSMACGFGSLRRFQDLFRKRYRLSPTALRRQAASKKQRADCITLQLAYRPPYLWERLLGFLAPRAIAGVELIRDNTYLRTVHLIGRNDAHFYGWIRVENRPETHALAVTIADTLLPVLPQVLARVKNLFDLHCDPEVIAQGLSSMNDIQPKLYALGTRLPGSFDAFEMAVRAVLGQQITVKAANTLAARLVAAYGVPLQTGIHGLSHVFPSPRAILDLGAPIQDYLCPIGVLSARAKTIGALAEALDGGEIHFGASAQPEAEMKKLLAIPGIGPWSAQYIAMRAMGWPDAFLETDAGIKKALAPRTGKEMLAVAEAWRPWRSYATLSLWNSL